MCALTCCASLLAFGWNSTATQQAGEALAEEIRADYAATSGYDGVRVYASYGHGNEAPEQIYGVNYARLQQLKAKWDPDNVFRFFHAITPTASQTSEGSQAVFKSEL